MQMQFKIRTLGSVLALVLGACTGDDGPGSVSEPSTGARAERHISGYVAFDLEQEEEHSETKIVVAELIADDHESRRALFGALSSMRDQVSEIVVELPESDPLERALVDPDATDTLPNEVVAASGFDMEWSRISVRWSKRRPVSGLAAPTLTSAVAPSRCVTSASAPASSPWLTKVSSAARSSLGSSARLEAWSSG